MGLSGKSRTESPAGFQVLNSVCVLWGTMWGLVPWTNPLALSDSSVSQARSCARHFCNLMEPPHYLSLPLSHKPGQSPALFQSSAPAPDPQPHPQHRYQYLRIWCPLTPLASRSVTCDCRWALCCWQLATVLCPCRPLAPLLQSFLCLLPACLPMSQRIRSSRLRTCTDSPVQGPARCCSRPTPAPWGEQLHQALALPSPGAFSLYYKHSVTAL